MSKDLATGLPNIEKPEDSFIQLVYTLLRTTTMLYSTENERRTI